MILFISDCLGLFPENTGNSPADGGAITVNDLWKRFESWLAANALNVLGTLRKGATPKQIASAEKVFQTELPKDFVDFYSIHDGQDHPECFALHKGGIVNGCLLLPLKTMFGQWSVLKELHDRGEFKGISGNPDGPIKNDWWNPAWIPLVSNSSGDHPVCLDLAPKRGGK